MLEVVVNAIKKIKTYTMDVSSKRRKALSNVVGSLLLIILTIVAALVLGHFVFGLFSSNSHNAQISISDVSIINPGGTGLTSGSGVSVVLTITDTGNDPVKITSISIGGITVYAGGHNIVLQPGQSLSFTGTITTNFYGGLTLTLTTTPSGSSNSITLSNSANINANAFNVGSTVVIKATGTDIVTNQQLATQVSTVVED